MGQHGVVRSGPHDRLNSEAGHVARRHSPIESWTISKGIGVAPSLISPPQSESYVDRKPVQHRSTGNRYVSAEIYDLGDARGQPVDRTGHRVPTPAVRHLYHIVQIASLHFVHDVVHGIGKPDSRRIVTPVESGQSKSYGRTARRPETDATGCQAQPPCQAPGIRTKLRDASLTSSSLFG
jgi:hypothetical protein